jgi:peptide/nickel transport system substrate-binding protein
MILQFDRAKEASAIYDPSKIGPFSSFMATFRGVRILSEDPLVIETWSDSWQLDAEQNVSTWWPAFTGSIGYNRAQGAWHNTTLGIMAETQELAAFSNAKAEELQVLWMNYIAGPTLDILADKLAEAFNAGYIPYGPTLGLYISSEEAQDRWNKLNSWYSTRGHLWIGTGPFYLEQVSVTDKQLMLMSHTAFPDDPDKWEEFIEPAIAEVKVNGPESIERGEEAVYSIQITLNGQPYPNKDIEAVKFMVLDSQNRVRLSGEATPVSTIGSFSANNAILTTDGIWRVILDAEMTLQLPPGANTLEVAVISKRVNIPSYASQPFTGPDAEIYMPIVLGE